MPPETPNPSIPDYDTTKAAIEDALRSLGATFESPVSADRLETQILDARALAGPLQRKALYKVVADQQSLVRRKPGTYKYFLAEAPGRDETLLLEQAVISESLPPGATQWPVPEIVLAAMEADASPLATGQIFGRYLLEVPIGAGAFGDVWRARHLDADIVAAVKFFRKDRFEAADRLSAAVRFFNGPSAMRKIASPKVVTVLDGPLESNGWLWFAMEFLEAGDLSKALLAGKLNNADRISVFNDLVDALSDAHGRQVVHRDVRPHNILIRGADPVRALITDFDIAYLDNIFARNESTSAPLGVARYLPPELFRSGDRIKEMMRRPSNDVYAACVVLGDLFLGVGAPLPDRRSDGSAQVLQANPEMASSLADAVASIIVEGTQLAEARRITTVGVLRARWRHAIDPGRALPVWMMVIAVEALVIAAICVDAAWYSTGDSVFKRVAASAVALVSGVSPALAWVFSSVEAWRATFLGVALGRVVEWTARRRAYAWGGALVLAALIPVAVLATGLPERASTVIVRGASGCHILNQNNDVVARLRNRDAFPLHIAFGRKVVCPEPIEPVLGPQSILTPQILTQVVEEIDAGPTLAGRVASVRSRNQATDEPSDKASPVGPRPPVARAAIADGTWGAVRLRSFRCPLTRSSGPEWVFLRARSTELFKASSGIKDFGPWRCRPGDDVIGHPIKLFDLPESEQSVSVALEVRRRDQAGASSVFLGRAKISANKGEGWPPLVEAVDGATLQAMEGAWMVTADREGGRYVFVLE